MNMNDKLPQFDKPMKASPNLHPVHLLRNVSSVYQPTPPLNAELKAQLVTSNGVEMILSREGFLQIQLTEPARVAELRVALQRALGVWDHTSPEWLWQLDALLDPQAREIAQQEGANHGRP